MVFKKKKKYTCCFCSNINEKSSKKPFFCKECLKIRNWLLDNGRKSLLDKLEYNKLLATAPPYNN